MMISYLEPVVNFPLFKWVGLFFVLKIAYSILSDLYKGFVLYVWPLFAPSRNFVEEYGKWAVITGGSDGIGKYIAFELAAKGMNVFILSNVENALKTVSREIEEKHGVKTKWHYVDFSDLSCYKDIEKELKDLNDIGVLVNNVGMINEDLKIVPEQPEAIIKKTICVNTIPTAMMTRIIVPKMMERRKGLILNVGSKTAQHAIPCTTIYGGTKAFVRKFSECFIQEVEDYGIQVACVEPGFVKSGLLTRDPNSRAIADFLPSIACPNPEDFAKSVVRVLSVRTPLFFTGYWYHALENTIAVLLGGMPVKLLIRKFLLKQP